MNSPAGKQAYLAGACATMWHAVALDTEESLMLADTYVAVARAGLSSGMQVELAVPTINLSRISQLEHVGGELLRFSYLDAASRAV